MTSGASAFTSGSGVLSPGQIIEVLRAAGEPTRLRILCLLAREELAVSELARVLEQSQPRVSRHLKLMAEAGLIERFPEGSKVFYRLGHEAGRRDITDTVLSRVGALSEDDDEGLERVRRDRQNSATAYFESIAPQWDHMRSLYLADEAVEGAVERAVGEGPFRQLVDLGTGSGRMLVLLGPKAKSSVGLDISQNMLDMARQNVAAAGIPNVMLRHGDIHDTRMPDACADLVVIHQVLHYLDHPESAFREGARLVKPGGRLLVVDFAEHPLDHLRDLHRHHWLGFPDRIVSDWCAGTGLSSNSPFEMRSSFEGLTVKIWVFIR